ncbi:hypothetical protein FACS1894180_9000 [Bacteroidia bacterium]|nr:hypothetical protein FACS1894180_9000 [Bacteroidia bacterium]
MIEIFNNLPPDQKIFWAIAAFATIIFVIQTIMTFVGMDAMDGANADFDGGDLSGDEPFQLFTFRNLINFLLGFGWAGIAFAGTISNRVALMLVAALVGIAFIAVFFLAMKMMMKLAENNSFSIDHTLNLTGDVYLPVPAQKSGRGKVSVSVRGAMHEIDCITEGERIATGATVRIVKIESPTLVVVERL